MTTYKTTAITNLDASPIVRASAGAGAAGNLKNLSATITVVDGSTTSDLYLVARVRSDVQIKHLWFWIDASVTTLGLDIGTYYSDSTTDGTSKGNVATTILSGTSSKIAVNFDAHTAAAPLDLWSAKTTGGAIVGADMNKPLWQSVPCALATDPQGFIDIVMVPHATTSGAAVCNFMLEYVSAGD